MMYQPRDEISLRELYLIFKSGLVAIIIVAVLAGAAAYLFMASRPARYEASATVQVVAPQPATSGSETASLVPQVGFGPQAYTSLANSSAVLREAFHLRSTDPEVLRELSERLSLKAIDTSAQARGQLTVEHTASASSPEEAAERANAWAAASAAAATNSMQATVEKALAAATRELAARRAELDAAQARWTAFAKEDARASLRSQIDQLALQQAASRARLTTLDALIAASSAQQGLLAASVGSREGKASALLSDQLRTLVDSGVLTDASSKALAAAIGQLPPGVTVGGQDLLTLVDRAQLQTVATSLAGQVAERAELQNSASEAEATGAALRDRLADLEERAAEPQTALAIARGAYDRVAAVMPLLSLQQALVADSAQVVIQASPPLRPMPRNAATITLAAVLVGGLIATLFVFLRAAVAEPPPPHRPGRSPTTIDQLSGKLTNDGDEPLTFSDPGR